MQAVVLRLPPPGLSFNIAAVFKTPSTGNPNSQLRQLLLRSSLKIPRNKSRNHPSITTLPFLRNKSERKRQGYFSHYGRFPPLYFRLEGSHYYLHSQSTTLHPETPLTHLHMQENLPHSGDLCELALGHFFETYRVVHTCCGGIEAMHPFRYRTRPGQPSEALEIPWKPPSPYSRIALNCTCPCFASTVKVVEQLHQLEKSKRPQRRQC